MLTWPTVPYRMKPIPVATETTTTCTDGKIWNEEKKECVAPEDMKKRADAFRRAHPSSIFGPAVDLAAP